MAPNVVGMSQHADGGLMATKPYPGGGAYISPAELDIHIAEVEASVATQKGLLAAGEVPGEEGAGS